MSPTLTPDFDAMFRSDPDPWGYRTRWYERRKRELTLAALPRARYRLAFEPGCGNGELSAALALRCERLLAVDASMQAVALARQRLQGQTHVEVQALRVPESWPEAAFDLIVVSELAYYLDESEMAALCTRCMAALAAGATVIACHWRRPIDDALRTGDAVHERLDGQLGHRWAGGWLDPDFRIDVWVPGSRSVAEQEGLLGPA